MRKKMLKSIIYSSLITLIVLSNMFIALAVETYTWEEKAGMNIGIHSHASVEADGKLYVIGGRTSSTTNSQTLEQYNPETNTWVTKANMLTGRRFFGVASYNGKIFVFGGVTDNNTYSTSVEAYNIATDTWEAKTDMPTGRISHKAVTVGDEIFVIGGRNGTGGGDMLNAVEIYNPNNDTWETGTSMPTARYDFGMTKIGSNIYIMGGLNLDGPNIEDPSADLQVFDTELKTWSTKASMISPRDRFESIAVNNKIYIIGGSQTEALNIEVYDSETNIWDTVSQLPAKQIIDHACSSIGNKIFLTGGYSYLDKLEVITVPIEDTPSPTNLTASPDNAQVTLNWSTVDSVDSYTLKRSTTAGGPYTDVATNLTNNTYVDTNVVNGTTYYYVVVAVKNGAESGNSNEASATPIAPVVNRALLNITMQNGLIKEYDMTMTEVDGFISWYNSTSGSNLYTINKSYNIGPFLNRKDYIVKDMIVCFEIMEYENIE